MTHNNEQHPENIDKNKILDSLYSALDLIRNELGEGEVTEKLRVVIAELE